MKYPMYVWQDHGTAYGATLPDLPGVNTAADTLDELDLNAQEAVEVMYHDSDVAIPPPSPDFKGKFASDPLYNDGFWMMVDIDLSKITSRSMRLNISLPERLVEQIDLAAKKRRLSRSAFLALAAQHEMAQV